MEKVILILVDGMRSDSLKACGNDYAVEFAEKNHANVYSKTVMPSVTLPCHLSLFLSVPPERHGILSNTYVPQVRPVGGLIESLCNVGKKCAMFYCWEELRDIVRPGYLDHFEFIKFSHDREVDVPLTNRAVEYIKTEDPDFVFLYLGATDEFGHRYGWMSDEYNSAVSTAWDCIKKVREKFPDHTVIVTADHGGHNQSHGADIPEDMNIPIIISSKHKPTEKLACANIMDIAPTVADLLDAARDSDWTGEPLLRK